MEEERNLSNNKKKTKMGPDQELINENDPIGDVREGVRGESARGAEGAKEKWCIEKEGEPTFGQFSRPRLGSHLVGS